MPPLGVDPQQRRTILMCAIAVVAGTAAMLLLVVPSHDAGRQPAANPQFTFPAPSAAVSLLPPPASTPTGRPSDVRTTASTSRPARHVPASSSPPRAVTPQLTIGATVGLEVAGKRGLRVRHLNFLARLDQLSSTSSAADKADARFIVRKGLAFDGCVSFEAVSYPGFFLRRFFSDLVLHQQSSSTIYEQEATFCPIPTRDGKGLTLLALLPSGFAVTAGPDGRLHLDSTDKTAPVTFVVRQPL